MMSIRNLFQNSSANPLNMLSNIQNLSQTFQKFAKDPFSELIGMKYNIPSEISGNPQAIVQHLISSGQMTSSQFNQMAPIANQFYQMMNKR